MALGKSKRFEVFARDGFTCQYCGLRPPGVVLEVDHIHPQSKGGSDDLINLVTACADCNRGKSDKVLSGYAPRPDADLAMLAMQQELAEARAYLLAKEQRDTLDLQLCSALEDVWTRYLTPEMVPKETIVIPWITRYGAREVEESIVIASWAYRKGQFGWNESRAISKLVPYIGAILRNHNGERGEDGLG